MVETIQTTFDSIESAHEFVTLLSQTVAQAKRDLEGDVQRERSLVHSRRLDALRVAVYTLQKLELHVNRSRCALNDLRTLRRLLFDERSAVTPSDSSQLAGRPTVRTPARTLTAEPPHASHPTAIA